MAEALEDEEHAIRQDPRNAPIPLTGGVRVEADAFGATYRFSSGRRVRARVGTEVVFLTGEGAWAATVARPPRRRNAQYDVVLRFGRDFGVHAPTGDLATDTAWMKRRLARGILNPSPGNNEALARAAIAIAAPLPSAELPGDISATVPDEVTGDQREAVELSLTRPVAHVWGPPGTGKTFTMGRCAAAHAALGRTVLVVAPSNAAADVAALQVASLMEGHPGFEQGLVLRVGPVQNPELRRLYGDRVELTRLAARMAGKRGDAKALAKWLLAGCQVVITTIQRTYLTRAVAERRYDVLLIDEAGMCTLPEVYAAARLANQHVTVFGDFRQLPAVVTATTPAAHRWLCCDPFQAHSLYAAVLEDRPTPGMVMLREQRRMADPIRRVVSEGWYGNALTTHHSVIRRPVPFSDRWNSVTLLDTARLSPRAQIDGGDRTNPVHAGVVGALLDELIDYGDLRPEASEEPSVSLLTPYCGQADLLYDLGRGRQLRRALRVSTVHGAQGDEADAIILDLSDARGAPLSGFLRGRRMEDVGSRLLNVAISRARHRLFVVADTEFLRREAPRDGAVHLLLHLLEEHGAVEDAVTLLQNHPERRMAS
jgi:hypothetical protein